MAFSPLGNFLCILLDDAILNQKLNLLGRVTSDNVDILESFKVGDYLSIKKSHELRIDYFDFWYILCPLYPPIDFMTLLPSKFFKKLLATEIFTPNALANE